MKLMKYITLFVAVAGLFSACTSDLEQKQILPDDQLVAPVLKKLAVSEVAITPANLSDKLLVEWDEASFGEKIIFSYVLSFTYNDAEFDVVTGIKENKAELSFNQIQSALETMKVAAEETVDVKLRVRAKVGTTGPTLYTDYATIKVSYTKKTETPEEPEGGENTEE